MQQFDPKSMQDAAILTPERCWTQQIDPQTQCWITSVLHHLFVRSVPGPSLAFFKSRGQKPAAGHTVRPCLSTPTSEAFYFSIVSERKKGQHGAPLFSYRGAASLQHAPRLPLPNVFHSALHIPDPCSEGARLKNQQLKSAAGS